MAGPAADFLITLQDGRVKAQGSVNEVLKTDPALFVEEKTDEGTSRFSSLFSLDVADDPFNSMVSL